MYQFGSLESLKLSATRRREVAAPPFTREDIPETLRRQFQGVKETAGGFVLAFPNIKLSDGLEVNGIRIA